jgi:uncharacterized Zn finger protein (UPF0148 family)
MTERTAGEMSDNITGMITHCPQCGAPVELPRYVGTAICGACGSTLVRQESPRAAVSPQAGDEPVLRSVRCSQCAGPLVARGGERVLTCSHCGVRVAVAERDGFSSWYFPTRVERIKAVGVASAWLAEYRGIAKRARGASIGEARLVYAPIWEYKALVVGWEFGNKLRTRCELVGEEGNERLDLQLVREGVEEPHLQERRFYQAATDFAALGATRPRVSGREPILPLLAGELDPSAQILDPDDRAASVAERGRKAVLQPVAGAESPDAHLFALRESTTLLFYPLWLLRYRDGNRLHTIAVNGRDGTVNSATAPAAVIDSVLDILPLRRSRKEREVEYHEPFSS